MRGSHSESTRSEVSSATEAPVLSGRRAIRYVLTLRSSRPGEYDAMAVAQGLAIPESSVPGKKKAERKGKKKVGIVLPGSAPSSSSSSSAAESADTGAGGEGTSSWDLPAISLPNGCNSLPADLIPLLERFTRIYLWMDNDKSGAVRYYACLAAQCSIGQCSAVQCSAVQCSAEKSPHCHTVSRLLCSALLCTP